MTKLPATTDVAGMENTVRHAEQAAAKYISDEAEAADSAAQSAVTAGSA
jgi:hypothetical protein